MKRFVALMMLIVLLAVPTSAFAEDYEWVSDPPKQGTAGFHLCVGYAEAGGHTYRNTNYIDDEVLANCDRYARADVVNHFRFYRGIEIDPASVKVTVAPIK